MDASEVFKAILQSIESSSLNYSLSKTPFSANISLKCSFIKRYQKSTTSSTFYNIVESIDKNSTDQDDIVKKLEADNLALRTELEKLRDEHDSEQKTVLEETVQIQNLYDTEKDKSKDLEKNIAGFREEVLQIKREKHKLSDELKIKLEECENLKLKVEVSKKENVALKTEIKDKSELVESKNVELFNTKCECESAKENLSKSQSELENLEQKNKASESKVYQCERCDVSTESYSQLKLHNRHDHCQNKVTQYENKFVFFKYNCFYCDDGFDSEDDLAKHPTDCHNKFNDLPKASAQLEAYEWFDCDICGVSFDNVKDIERHMKVEHLESEVFWCDVCPLYFETNCELQFHIRGCHWDHM